MHPTVLPAVLLLDRLLGEPPARWHPVAAFGRLARALEQRSYADSVSRGTVFTGSLVAVGAASGVALERLIGRRWACVAAGLVCVAGRMLSDEVAAVARDLDRGDLDGARCQVGRLVGRDTEVLDASGVARAAVETMAENTVDAVTAPLFWGAVGGAPALVVHRVINTLDAMVGHRDDRYERFGKVAARTDDVANWLPARLTALAVAATRPARSRSIVGVVRRDAGRHPSPNGGVVEAAFAAALGVSLGGVNRYGGTIDDRGILGDGPPPNAGDIRRSIALARDVWWTTAVALALVAYLRSGAAPFWRRSS